MKYLKKFENYTINEELVMGAGAAERFARLSKEIDDVYKEYLGIKRSSPHTSGDYQDDQSYAIMHQHSSEKQSEDAADKKCYNELIAILKEWRTTDSNFVEMDDTTKEKVRKISGLKDDQISSLEGLK
jgi:hypothetical protein